MILENNQLKQIYGGSSDWTIATIVGIAITFIAGIFDGILRPIKCN